MIPCSAVPGPPEPGSFTLHPLQCCAPVQAMMRIGKHAEALGETRSLTVEGDPAASEVLAVRAEALYGSGNMERAVKMYEEVYHRQFPEAMA